MLIVVYIRYAAPLYFNVGINKELDYNSTIPIVMVFRAIGRNKYIIICTNWQQEMFVQQLCSQRGSYCYHYTALLRQSIKQFNSHWKYMWGEQKLAFLELSSVT